MWWYTWEQKGSCHRGVHTVSVTDKRWCTAKTMGCLWHQKRKNDFTNFLISRFVLQTLTLKPLFFSNTSSMQSSFFISYTKHFTLKPSAEGSYIRVYPLSTSISINQSPYNCSQSTATHRLRYAHTDTKTQIHFTHHTSLLARRLSVWFLLACPRCWHLCARSIDFVVLS